MTAELRDVRGTLHRFDRAPRRVVSLVPSITETLFDLGVGGSVVGVTDWCIFPEGLELPRVGGTKNPHVDAIRALAPDLVHMNLEENLRRHADAIAEFAPVFVSEPKSPRDVIGLFEVVGAIHECQAAATMLAESLEAELRQPPLAPFTFACPIWKEPWMWCGGDTYVSALVESVGGRNVIGDRDRYPSVGLEEIARLAPEVVFLPDEPYAFTKDDATSLRRAGFPRVLGPFPGHFFTWHGSRTIVGLTSLRSWMGDSA